MLCRSLPLVLTFAVLWRRRQDFSPNLYDRIFLSRLILSVTNVSPNLYDRIFLSHLILSVTNEQSGDTAQALAPQSFKYFSSPSLV